MIQADLVLDVPAPQAPSIPSPLFNEWSWTPPLDFSLNDLIQGRLKKPLQGMFYNGSFDEVKKII